jgi:S1-C subfamily serine protease
MISSLVKAPELFPLTVGFSSLEFASVLYDDKLNPVGILGELSDPTPRSSGSGMMDSFGRLELPLLGVITADRLEKMIASPPRRGQVDRSWLGITMQSLTPDIAEFLVIESPGGIIVNKVIPGSPAAEAGLMVGDVIYSVNDQQIEVDRDEELSIFQRHVSGLGVGSSVELAVVRPTEAGLDSLTLLAVLKAAPLAASDAENYEYEPFELTVRNLVFSDFLNYNLGQDALTGVVVSELRPGGLAAIAGLRPADVIQRVNDQAILSVDDFSAYLATVEAEKPAELVFFVWRFGKTLFVNVKTDWD